MFSFRPLTQNVRTKDGYDSAIIQRLNGIHELTAMHATSWRNRRARGWGGGACLLRHGLQLGVSSGALSNRKATPDSQIAEQRAAFNKNRLATHIIAAASCPCLASVPCHILSAQVHQLSAFPPLSFLYSHTTLPPLSFPKPPPPSIFYCRRHHCNNTTALVQKLCMWWKWGKTKRE